jgi:antigen 43
MIVHDPLRARLTDLSTSTPVDTSRTAALAELRHGGLLVGTHVLTPDGDQPIETLRRGDQMVTLLGPEPRVAPIVWIGRRHAQGQRTLVRIRRDAIADGTPREDIVLAADHAVYLQNALYAPGQLVNGATLLWDLPGRALWTLQLAQHNIIMADGLPVETMLQPEARAAFAEVTAPRLRVVRKVGVPHDAA